jgi:hypothetical protein
MYKLNIMYKANTMYEVYTMYKVYKIYIAPVKNSIKSPVRTGGAQKCNQRKVEKIFSTKERKVERGG